jgi:hypothetical protein
VPAYSGEMEFGEMGRKLANKEFEVEGRNFVLASKKGRRTSVMEDGYGVMLDILGDPKQVGDHHVFSLISLRRCLWISTSNRRSSLETVGQSTFLCGFASHDGKTDHEREDIRRLE